MKAIKKANTPHKLYAAADKKVTRNSNLTCKDRDLCMVKHG